MCSESGVGKYSSLRGDSDAALDISGNLNSLRAGSAIEAPVRLA